MSKEEIKEILELHIRNEIDLLPKNQQKALDYITNLQERFNALLEAHKIADELETEYQNRIDKALDIIEQKRGEYDIPDELEKVLKGE